MMANKKTDNQLNLIIIIVVQINCTIDFVKFLACVGNITDFAISFTNQNCQEIISSCHNLKMSIIFKLLPLNFKILNLGLDISDAVKSKIMFVVEAGGESNVCKICCGSHVFILLTAFNWTSSTNDVVLKD